MKKALMIIFLFCSLQSFSQSGTIGSSSPSRNNFIGTFKSLDPLKTSNYKNYQNVKGSQYLDENFTNSTISYEDNDSVSNIKLRYNIIDDSFEIIKRGNLHKVKKDDNIKKITIDKNSFCYKSIKGEPSNTIVQIIYDHKIKLYLKHQAHFFKATTTDGYNEAKPNRFEISAPKLYLKTPFKDSLIRIKSLKDFSKIFPRNKSEIKKFIKKNKIKIDNKDQLIQLALYLEDIA